MNRRHALLSIATTVAVAGCLGTVNQSTTSAPNEQSPSTADRGSDTGDASGTADATAAGRADADARLSVDLPDPPFAGMRAEPAATYVVGEQTGTAKATPGAHVVQVWNDGPDTRELTVRITGQETGTQFDDTVDVAPGDHLNFAFRTPDAYTVEVSGEGISSTATVDREWNECSTSMTTIRLSENGTETRSVSESRTC
jgi:hypothetical protein